MGELARESAPVPREQYERDVLRMGQEAAELRSALRTAHRRLVVARELIAPGMRAGTSQAKEILTRGAEEAAKALDEKRVGDPEQEKEALGG